MEGDTSKGKVTDILEENSANGHERNKEAATGQANVQTRRMAEREPSEGTFTIVNEDHTLANPLKFMLNRE